jgi:SAM-dependent methyltransferase
LLRARRVTRDPEWRAASARSSRVVGWLLSAGARIHRHADDALEQLHNLFAVLAPNGSFFCVTPNRLNGPHDVSKYFDTVARGFHLKEYTVTELEALFLQVGFRRVEAWPRFNGRYVRLPLRFVKGFERLFAALPVSWRRGLGKRPFIRNVLSAPLRAIK